MGLCVGHDSIFYRFCDGLCTAPGRKGPRPGAHSAGALYETGSFYRALKDIVIPSLIGLDSFNLEAIWSR